MAQITEAIAVSLNNQGLRQRILTDMREAPFREHKLELASYLAGQSGGILRAAMRQNTGLTTDEIDELLAEAPPLEFYMPVAEHRRSWTGTADVVVASIRDDWDLPVAFDVHGEPVELEPYVAPTVPTLSVVPVETDFSRPLNLSKFRNQDDAGGEAIGQYERTFARMSLDGGDGGCGGENALLPCEDGGGGGTSWSWTDLEPGLYMSFAHIDDMKEGGLRGEPELETHFISAINVDATSNMELQDSDRQCTCESCFQLTNYVQNDNTWNASFEDSPVQIAAQPFLDEFRTEFPDEEMGFNVMIFEDDATTCTLKPEDPDTLGNKLQATRTLIQEADAVRRDPDDLPALLQLAQSVYETLTSISSNKDDFVGQIIERECSASPDGNTREFSLFDGTQLNGCITLRHVEP